MNDRKAVSLDINPLSVFIMRALITPVKHSELMEAYNKVSGEYKRKEPKIKKDIKEILKEYPCSKNLPLPKSSDVEYVCDLFSDKQMAELALQKAFIKKQKNQNIKNTLLLVFSSSLNKHNLTFHYTQSAGDCNSNDRRRYRER
jgi:phosphopantothenate synthetase